MTLLFHELLLSELRMVTYCPGEPDGITDELLCKVVTLDENLRSMGYVLKPEDLVRLAVSPSLPGFFKSFRKLVPDVKAKPMYPGFPQQVMEMSEAEFRLHQFMHYFSTYGLELLSGREVHRGWLPEYEGPERTETDTSLMKCRVISLIPEEEAPVAVLKTLLGRRERLTNPELALVLECAPLCTAGQLEGLTIRFKENLDLLFPRLMKEADRAAALRTLRAVCAHTGDVLRCGRDYLGLRRYHLTTSEKKLLVRLLEAYPVGNLKENLMQSLRLRERNLLFLQHLDYNRFSRSPEHREAVRALRNGELLSWHGIGELLLKEHSPKALDHLSRRPGYMLRMMNRLLSLGYEPGAIEDALLPQAGAVSAHLLVKTIRTLLMRSADPEGQLRLAMEACQAKYADALRSFCIIPLKERQESVHHNAESRRETARSDARHMAEHQAWEDAYRPVRLIDADIREKKLLLREKTELLHRMENIRFFDRVRGDAHTCFDVVTLYTLLYGNDREKLDEAVFHCPYNEFVETITRLETELSYMKTERIRLNHEVKARYAELRSHFGQEAEKHCREELEKIDSVEREELEAAERAFELDLAEQKKHDARRNIAVKRMTAELEMLKAQYSDPERLRANAAKAVEILKAVLREHFRQAATPLKGKKVFCDLGEFDLCHSTLETEDRSRDGGYIRSGICYRIPGDARYVRFFVYWNDQKRVDVDLHAGGRCLDGTSLHVGWNADFRSSGVVHSGDITHSDAAEYIDIDLSAPLKEIYANVHLYSGGHFFKDITTCYVGMMAVDKAKQEVKLYDPKNCFFTHRLTQNTRRLFYGYVDVQDRYVRFVGQPNAVDWCGWDARPGIESDGARFSLQDYLDCVLEGQDAVLIQNLTEADVVLTMGRSLQDNGISLADSNFFLEC